MNLYFKISTLAFILGITAVVVVIHSSSYRGSIECPSTPAFIYENGIKNLGYGCRLSGFPIPYLENDVLGHNPHFYFSRWLLDVLIWSLIFFWLLTYIRNYLKGFFQAMSAINKVTRSTVILELLPIFFVFLAYLGHLPIREGSDGDVQELFDIYINSWWPGFSQWFLIHPIPVIALLGILFGIRGLVYERRVIKSGTSGIEEDLKTKILGKFVLYLPFPLAIIWIFLTIQFYYGGIA
ncbi:MAG: hypothetical protein UU96_C0033G0007 [Parcubacteria group bacterium GW2011_GWC2_42_13]|nr:MAG: hypothetical protein UU96_C0033G0007 [Parcubacteria group bacterium GW2011_GWC2_42_13]